MSKQKSYRWSIDIELSTDEDGQMEFDYNVDGPKGVGDVYALHRANNVYDTLLKEGSLSEEGKETIEKAKSLNDELLTNMAHVLFDEKGDDHGDSSSD